MQTTNTHRIRQTLGPTNSLTYQPVDSARKGALRRMYSSGFPYTRYHYSNTPSNHAHLTSTRKLAAHTSCVNNLIFSRDDSRWLARRLPRASLGFHPGRRAVSVACVTLRHCELLHTAGVHVPALMMVVATGKHNGALFLCHEQIMGTD